MYKAVIFDLDGTLIDSLEDLGDSVNEMLEGRGLKTHALSEYRYFVGNGPAKLIERALPPGLAQDKKFFAEALAEFKSVYAKRGGLKTKAYAGISELLEVLQSRRIPLGICTNKHQSAAEVLAKKFFPRIEFGSVMGDREGFPPKPDPKKALFVADKLGVSPADVAYLGDSDVDMQTALNAGFLPVGVLWGFRDKEELIGAGAKVLLENPAEFWEKVDLYASSEK